MSASVMKVNAGMGESDEKGERKRKIDIESGGGGLVSEVFRTAPNGNEWQQAKKKNVLCDEP